MKFRHRETEKDVFARRVGLNEWEVSSTSEGDDATTLGDLEFEALYEFPDLSAVDVLAAEDEDGEIASPESDNG